MTVVNTGIHTDIRLALDPAAFWNAAGLGKPEDWQIEALRSDARQALFNCARQSGKSTVASCLAVWTACYKPGSVVLMVSRTLDYSGELFRRALTIYKDAGRPVPAASETALSLTLENGSRIISRPGSSDTSVRGYTCDLLIIDEASRVPDDLYNSATPVLAKTGGKILALSTPHGKRGWWYHAWQSKDEPWQRYQVTAYDLPADWYKPSTEEHLELEKARMDRWFFRSEYMCEFGEAEGSFFREEDLRRALTLKDLEEPPMFPESCAV
jgi:hypothetical protein